ncbi:hypothetical protein J6590_020929 [Homalodisca vitripennis]|nr:hypothetical protein J6590_020929 [Homalodisca vitripennis]
MVIKSKKNIPKPIPKTYNGNLNPIELRNQFEVLQVDEDETSNVSDLSIDGSHNETHMNKVLICADSHGRDLAWHLNKIHKDHEATSHTVMTWLVGPVVNKEVAKTNKRLEELSGKYSNVTLVKSSKAERALHTRQGLHLNFWGKKWLAEVVAKAITAKKDPDHRQGLRDVQPPPPEIFKVVPIGVDNTLIPYFPIPERSLEVGNLDVV